MTQTPPNGLISRQRMTEDELDALAALVHLCNQHEGLDVKINWDMLRERSGDPINDFLYVENGRIVGYASLDGLGGEFELTGVVHPDYRRRGIFTALYAAAIEEARRVRAERVLLVCERASASGQAFAATTGARYESSEYRMIREPTADTPASGTIVLRQASAEDLDLIAQLQALSFGDSIETARENMVSHLGDTGSRIYIALLDGQPIGKIEALVEPQGAYIRAFGVLPELRGRGYGRQILSALIRAMLDEDRPNLMLEVATENRNALGLYQSCGFLETTVYDYFVADLG